MRSVPPVSLYFLDPVLQAEYQRFMSDFTTKFQTKNGQRSACISMFFGTGFAGRVPAVHACFYYKISTTQKWAAFRLYLYVFWNRFCRQSTSAYQISYICLLSFGTKNKNKKTASHGCAEIPAGIPAGIPQLTGRWQKKKCCAPLCRPLKARWRFGPQAL